MDAAAVAHANEQNRLLIIAGVILASFLASLDTTILATAMPTIVGVLGGLPLYGWVFSVYMIMTAVSMPVWGALADTLGKKRVFFAAVVSFLLGSILCGVAQNLTQLIVFRGIQGIGAGGLASVPFALISTVFPVHQRGRALGVMASAWGISSVIGPLIGSVLVAQFTWRWIFFVNVPLGVGSLLVVARWYREVRARRSGSIDYVGASFLCVSIIALMLVFLWTGKGRPLLDPRVLVAAGIFCLTLLLFIRQERSVSNPILDMHFFTRRAFWLGNLLGFLASFAIYGVIAYLPLFAQTASGGTPVQAGVVITAMSLSWSTSSVTAGRIIYRVGERTLIFAGAIIMACGFSFLLAVLGGGALVALAAAASVIGIGMGCQTPSLMLTVQHSLDSSRVGVATSSQMLARTIGGALGVSVIGTAVAGGMQRTFASLAVQGSLASFPPEALSHIGDPQELLGARMLGLMSAADHSLVVSAFADAVEGAFVIGLVAVLLATAGTVFLPPSTLHRIDGR